MTGQNWPDIFCQEKFFKVLGKGVARGPGPPPNQNVGLDFYSKFYLRYV